MWGSVGSKTVPVINEAPGHEDLRGVRVGTAPSIHNLATRPN
jgi:hypothetical protein